MPGVRLTAIEVPELSLNLRISLIFVVPSSSYSLTKYSSVEEVVSRMASRPSSGTSNLYQSTPS